MLAITWLAGNGDWSDPADWSSQAAPGADDFVVLEAGNPTTITVNTPDTAVGTLWVDGHGVTLDINRTFTAGYLDIIQGAVDVTQGGLLEGSNILLEGGSINIAGAVADEHLVVQGGALTFGSGAELDNLALDGQLNLATHLQNPVYAIGNFTPASAPATRSTSNRSPIRRRPSTSSKIPREPGAC